MLVSTILKMLPAPLEWMVLFNLSAIRKVASPTTIRAMYHLPDDIEVDHYSHVVLTNIGRFLADDTRSGLIDPMSRQPLPVPERPLSQQFESQLNLFSIDEADCLGLGQVDPYPSVLLHITLNNHVGEAQAIFDQAPTTQHYELLKAIGVTYLGGEQQGDYYLARFQNRLPVHIHAGILSHFSRTAHCNLFFLQHGIIDQNLEIGLLHAAHKRLHWAYKQGLTALERLAQEACQSLMPMVCLPPPPDSPFGYGDLVPLGFVLRGLKTGIGVAVEPNASIAGASIAGVSIAKTVENLQTHLQAHCQNQLWAFHRNRLLTATDTSLVLQGMDKAQVNATLEVLETFAAISEDDHRGYYPQLWATDPQPGKMVLDESCRHWCQPDYATTCLIVMLHQQVGRSTSGLQSYLVEGMEHRSGLYFANPYLVDWVLAQALQSEPFNAEVEDLRQQLHAEVLASMNPDYSFGRYDLAFSTALAISTLITLGDRSRSVLAAQLRLLDLMQPDGRWPMAIPFYSSLKMTQKQFEKALLRQTLQAFVPPSPGPSLPQQLQLQRINLTEEIQYHGISLYLDSNSMISTALATMALAEPEVSVERLPLKSISRSDLPIHPRYQCRSHCEYIANFALPPYVAPLADRVPAHNSRVRKVGGYDV